MDESLPNLFAEFLPGERASARLGPGDGLSVRLARPADADSLGAISAEREGGPPARHAEAFARWIGATGDDTERLHVWAAELHGRVVGFGKAQYFRAPAGAPAHVAPEGWYLAGVVVAPEQRRRGVGALLTAERLRWIALRAPRAHYFASALNRASIELHRGFGFVEVTREFWYPAARFTGGVGILFEASLHRS